METKARSVAVLISDVHYSLPNLQLADAAMRQAIKKANELQVPLIVAGDLHDTKANLRGECVNAMLATFNTLDDNLPCFILRGNHDAINEKSAEHSIGFLNRDPIPAADNYYSGNTDMRAAREVVDKSQFTNEIAVNSMSVHFIPYQHDPEQFRAYLKKVDKGSCIIAHQGLEKANMGDYSHDKSAINHRDVAGFRVISGHYHMRQTIPLPDGGVWDYIGNPYTVSYGEANDPPKGFQILMSDGSLEFIPTNLRKHVIWNEVYGQNTDQPSVSDGDLLWIKMRGTREQLAKFKRSDIPLSMPFKLDLIPTDERPVFQPKMLTQGSLLDSLIDNLADGDERKQRLKDLWRGL